MSIYMEQKHLSNVSFTRINYDIAVIRLRIMSLKVHPHYAVWQNATHCTFAVWQKLLGICRQCDRVRRKKNFLQTFFRLQKLWNEIGELCLIFSSNWLIPFWNPLLIVCRTASIDGTDNLPIKFADATSTYTCGLVQLLPHDHAAVCHTA